MHAWWDTWEISAPSLDFAANLKLLSLKSLKKKIKELDADMKSYTRYIIIRKKYRIMWMMYYHLIFKRRKKAYIYNIFFKKYIRNNTVGLIEKELTG